MKRWQKSNLEKIITVKLDTVDTIKKDLEKIVKPFNLNEKIEEKSFNLIQSVYKVLIEKDASLIEINPVAVSDLY